jgi:integrase
MSEIILLAKILRKRRYQQPCFISLIVVTGLSSLEKEDHMFKRGGFCWTCIRPNGRKRQVSLETGNKKLAQEIESKLKTEILEGRYFDRRNCSKTIDEMLQKLMEEHAPTVSPRMRESYETSKKHLLDFFGGCIASGISPKDIYAYKVKRRNDGKSGSTINRELSMLSKAYNLAIRELEWLKENPISMASMEKEDNGRDRWLSPKKAEMLLINCEPLLRQVVTFAINTGMRQDEILSLKWPAVDLARRTVVVMKSKNGRRRALPLPEAAFNTLAERSKIRHLHSDFVFTKLRWRQSGQMQASRKPQRRQGLRISVSTTCAIPAQHGLPRRGMTFILSSAGLAMRTFP